MQRFAVRREDRLDALRGCGHQSLVDVFGRCDALTNGGERLAATGLHYRAWQLIQGCEQPRFEFVQREEGNEIRRSAELFPNALLDMVDAGHRRRVRACVHPGEIGRKAVVVEQGRHDRSPAVLEQAPDVIPEFRVARDAALEVRPILHPFDDQNRRLEEQLVRIERGRQHAFDEPFFCLPFDEDQRPFHGRAPRTFFSHSSPRE
ncbi:MAG TPA: hypothetical protein VEK57_16235 [Thermoanaerobaculia bacterium]|nr:hypothetical protein [Thermoanaerobaculia bacterium]